LTRGGPRCVAWYIDVSGYDGRREAGRSLILRGASFALVWCSEERCPSTEAGDILVVQVVVTIIFEKKRTLGLSLWSLRSVLGVTTDLLGCTGSSQFGEWKPSSGRMVACAN